jgi:hypothetical protein
MLKRLARRILAPLTRHVAWNVRAELSRWPPLVDKGAQILLSLKYQEMRRAGIPLPKLTDVEFRCYSQNGEDGILLYLFSLLGAANRRVVEICAGDGIECNAANLIINHHWEGLLIDSSNEQLAAGRRFYSQCKETVAKPPTLVLAWVTAENVNSILLQNGFQGPIDLLSLDLDGVDYWIWNALDCITPRVVIVEYVDALGPELALTVPYRPDFTSAVQNGVPFRGASLAAFNKLARRRGYRYVGSQCLGFNAFFVQNGVGDDTLPEVPLADGFTHRRAQEQMARNLARLRQLPWQEV